MHEQERDEHCEGQRQRHNQNAPEMQKKDDVRQGDQYYLFDQRALERPGRLLYQLRSIVEWDNFNSRRQTGLEIGNLSLYPVNHLLCVDPIARDHDTTDGFLSVLDE